MPDTAYAWFNDLAAAQTNVATIGADGVMCGDWQRSFYCQSGVVDDGSLWARTTLTNKGWTIYFFP